jgi:hypothetical protein
MLHDQVNELLLVDYFEQFDDVFLVDVFEDVNLVLQRWVGVFQEMGVRIFGRGHFDLLDCVRVAVEHFSERALGDHFLKAVLVAADELRWLGTHPNTFYYLAK